MSNRTFVDPRTWPPLHIIEPDELRRAKQERDDMAAQLEAVRAEVAQREEAAYRHGLGDRAAVLDQNRIMAATIAALTDRRHALNLESTHAR